MIMTDEAKMVHFYEEKIIKWLHSAVHHRIYSKRINQLWIGRKQLPNFHSPEILDSSLKILGFQFSKFLIAFQWFWLSFFVVIDFSGIIFKIKIYKSVCIWQPLVCCWLGFFLSFFLSFFLFFFYFILFYLFIFEFQTI